MSGDASPASSPEDDSPLARLQREADEEMDSETGEVLQSFYGESRRQLYAWRRRRELEVRHGDDSGSDNPATPRSSGPSYAEMHRVFPAVKRPDQEDEMQVLEFHDVAPPIKPKHNRWQAHQLRQGEPTSKTSNIAPIMGLFSLLPGELRNVIYRLAFVPPPGEQPVRVVGSDLICGRGACTHRKASVAAPAVASTCRQLRNEIMPIYCAENEFHFDATMVRNRCVHAWAESMNTYVRLIKRITLDVLVLSRMSLANGGGTRSRTSEITVTCPVARTDGKFEVTFSANFPEEKLEASELESLIETMNDGEEFKDCGFEEKLFSLLQSDELAELVFRCKK
ncbi:hypothetical protein LTR62_001369 [Meristemomyces frigidus]|uniref:Uncharacterized protein n=1 Tax=Meristemomyces frigidus TaxID=1508187 RepID=A0AAN7YMF2_9PEZI|nr:hypothetical protein LTR62_001369 [Meristemomyces frigidus]